MKGTVGLVLCMTHLLVIEVLAMQEEWQTWPIEELEHQMSCSRWNPNKHPDEVTAEYINVSIRETQNAQKNVPHELNIAYTNNPTDTQYYDVYGTNLPDSAPIFFWIHGGYWQEGSKDISGLLATNLASLGVKNIVQGYTLAPNASVTEIFQETLAALEHAMRKFPQSNFTIGGHSAGGQLAAMLLHTNAGFPEMYERIKGLVLVSGVYDLRLLVPTYINVPLKMNETEAESLSPLRLKTVSPGFLNHQANLKIFVSHGGLDSPEFQRQATVYANLLKATFPHTTVHNSTQDDHFTLVQNMANGTSEAGSHFSTFIKGIEDGGSNGSFGARGSLITAFLSITFAAISSTLFI